MEYRLIVPIEVCLESAAVHAGIHVADDVAVTGSANPTRRGLWGNMGAVTIH